MKQIWFIGLALVLAIGLGASSAVAQGKTITAKGKVTAVANDSVSIARGADTMKFNVDNATKVIAKGAGTKMRQTKEAGGAGVTLTDVVHEGDTVQIKYHDMGGGTLHAAEVRVRSKAPQPPKP